MTKNIFTIALCLLTLGLFGQSQVFSGKLVQTNEYNQLDLFLKHYEIYQIDAVSMHNLAMKNKTENLQFQLNLGTQHSFSLNLQENKIFKEGIQVRVVTENGIEPGTLSKIKCYNGYTAGDHKKVSLSINNNLLFGFITTDEGEYFVEPLWHLIPDAPQDQFIFYYAKDYIETKEGKCGMTEAEEYGEKLHNKIQNTKGIAEGAPLGCKEVEIAEAADRLMSVKYFDQQGVEDRITSMINLVQANYYGSFNDDLTLIISEFFIVDKNGTDPWTPSTDPSALLSSFRNWGPTNFGQHDVGELFTNRDFDGGTVGIAYLSAVCTSNRYNCIQDWTNNLSLLRVTIAHELGHNFSCQHDGSGTPYIMAPAVNNTNTWSSTSITSFNNFVPSRTCLAACSGGGLPPEADFSANILEGCKPLTVQFTDNSLHSPTSWNWTFPGGTPSSSNAKNPVVTYNNAGWWDVTLVATNNNGSDTESKQQYIHIKEKPIVSFTYTKLLGNVSFINNSTGGNIFYWEFGDGNFSTDEHPTHDYTDPGSYTVTLTVTNECGSTTLTKVIEIVFIPLANFSSNISSGCVQMFVNFEDESTFNPTSWQWTFPGGVPASSSLQNPVVSYSTPGVYDVTLVATNSAGSNTITITNYIKALDKPVPSFTQTITGYKVVFNNTTPGTDNTYEWNFGDGTTSTEKNPEHTYGSSGQFTVTLKVTNSCGSTTITKDITILAVPKAQFSSSVTSGCAPLTVNFTDNSTNNPSSWLWSFPGGNPSSSTVQNPTVIYNNPGSYNVTLIASNAIGSDTIEIAQYIQSITVPVVDFDVVMNGNVAVCTNISLYGATYLWDFGDGTTSNQENPVHTYGQAGNYTIKLTVTNDCGSNSVTKNVTAVFKPTASFTSDKVQGCATLTVNFQNTSSADATFFNWTFIGGNPATSTLKNPVVTYDTPGSYTVSLVAGNSAGTDTSMIVAYITVAGAPIPSFTYTNNSDGKVHFTNTSQNGISYLWDFGDGATSTEKDPIHKFETSGVKSVTLTVTNDCGQTSTTIVVVVIFPPSAEFSSDKNTGCGAQTITFEDLSTEGAVQWLWYFEGGSPSTSTDKNPVVQYNTPGSYDVTLIASNSIGSDTIVKPGFVLISSAPPVADFTYTSTGLTHNFTNQSTDAYSYLWNFGDGGQSTEPDPVHNYLDGGVYTIQLIAFNGCGSDTITENITVVGSVPEGSFSSDITSGCAPLIVKFTDKTLGGATAWQWSFPGGEPATSTEQNPTVIYNTAGVYDVTLIVSNLFGSDTIENFSYLVVNSVPLAKFSYTIQSGVVTFINQTTGGTNYLWNFGDGTSSTEQNPTHAYANPGQFTVTLTVMNECGSYTFTQIIDPKVGVREIDFIKNIKLFPNPNAGHLTLEINSASGENLMLKVVDIMGKMVYTKELKLTNGLSKTELNLQNLASGTYMVILESDKGILVRKMMIQ